MTLIILKTKFVSKITVNIVTQRVTSQAVINISQMNIIYIIIKCIQPFRANLRPFRAIKHPNKIVIIDILKRKKVELEKIKE